MARRNLAPAGLLLATVVVFCGITWARLHHGTGELFVSDGYFYYAYMPTWWIDHDLDFTNQYRHLPQMAAIADHEPTPTGCPSNHWPIGVAVLLSPAWLLVRALTLGRGSGWELYYQVPVYLLAFVYGLLGVALTYLLLCRFFPRRTALLTALAMGGATPLTAYIFFEPDFSHGISAFAVSAVALGTVWAAGAPSLRRMAALGVLLGVAMLVRPQNALMAAFIVIMLGRRPLREYAILLLCTATVFFAQSYTWHSMYGFWIGVPNGQWYKDGRGFMWWTNPRFGLFAFSPHRGLFPWAPVLLVALPGLALVPVHARRLALAAALVIAGEMYVNSAVRTLWTDGDFGQRKMADYVPLLAIGFAGAWQWAQQRLTARRLLAAFSIACLCFNWLLALRLYSHDLPEQIGMRELYADTFAFPARGITHRLTAVINIHPPN